jgi:hypothetical protein
MPIDKSIEEDELANQILYCKAFFTGCSFEVLKPGTLIPGQSVYMKN